MQLSHPNIVGNITVEYNEDDSICESQMPPKLLIKSECPSNMTLLQYCRQEPRPSFECVVEILKQVAYAMAYIHENDILMCSLQARHVYVKAEVYDADNIDLKSDYETTKVRHIWYMYI